MVFYLIANNLALDLMNTRIVENGEEVDLLAGYEDVLDWSAEAGLIDASQKTGGGKKRKGTKEADKLVDEVGMLRELIRSVVSDIVGKRPVSTSSLHRLNEFLERNRGFFALQRTEDGYEERFQAEVDNIESLLAPIAESAADLLCFVDPVDIRKCENAECVLYFYDRSKNHRRRWCSMAACGNRAKVAAFYKRKKTAV